MQGLPETRNALVLRTDFSDDAAWEAVCQAIKEPVGDFQAYVDCVSDPIYNNVTVDKLLELTASNSKRWFMFAVDQMTVSSAEHPILVIDLSYERGRTFRVIPGEMWGVENNLSLANMDFAEFADHVDPDGIFRGFPDE
jgi:hypothetical protein